MFWEKENLMAFDILITASPARLAPVEPRYASLFCFGLMTIACALASFAFACATPFAAFAVVAAAMLPLQSALLMTAAAWLVNQGIGFGFLHYPVDATTIVWGFVIGAAALAATAASALTLHAMRRIGALATFGAALIVAYTVYELVLFLATPFLGGAGNFTVAIVGRLGGLNAVWLIGLIAACEVARLFYAGRRQTAS
jgi:hypothetical protein